MARTQATVDALVDALQSNCGDLYGACRHVGVSLIFVRTWMKDDPQVREAIIEAERVGALALQSEAIRRAVQGDEKAVYFKGAVVGYEYPKSDGLLQTLLKGRLSDVYGKEAEGGITINGGQAQINIMPRASNYDEWLHMRESTLAARVRDDAARLAAPDTVIDVTPEGKGAYALMAPPSPFSGLDL